MSRAEVPLPLRTFSGSLLTWKEYYLCTMDCLGGFVEKWRFAWAPLDSFHFPTHLFGVLLWASQAQGMCTNVHSRLTHSNQTLRTTHLLISKRMDKLPCVHAMEYSLFTDKNEGATDTCKYRNQSQRHDFEQKKPDMKESIP